MEETPLSNARQWLLENPSKTATTASRIFKVPKSTLQSISADLLHRAGLQNI